MTENKRFRLAYEKGNWWAVRDGDITLWKEEVIGLLNELNDKCEFLEIENESLEDGATKYAELYHKSLKENEQLKNEKESWKKSWIEEMEDQEEQSKYILRLVKENEQLKSIKKFADRNGVCIFNIDEAFRRCWQDNAKLVKENEDLKGRVHGITREYMDWKFSAKKFQKKYQSAVKLLRVIKHELMTLNNLRLVDSNNDLVYVNFNDLLEKIEGEQLGVIGDCEELNRLYKENKKLKTAIKEAYENERTDLGRSVLKQLANNLEIEV